MTNYKIRRENIFLIAAIFIFMFSFSCQQTKEIPGQLAEDVPNPVSDFTEKDNYKLGLRWYQQGQYDIAKKMWKPMAESGDCDAEYAIGLLYFNGLGVRKNRDTALEWWERAAKQAQPQALNSLGIVYAHTRAPYTTLDCKKGCGEPRNLQEAYKWFGLAEKYGPPREVNFAQKSINRISNELSVAQIQEAKNMVEGWQPEPVKCKSRNLFIVN